MPWFSSVMACAGVLVFVVLSAYMGFRYWNDQGEQQIAVITVGAELIGFAGLAIVRYQWFTSKTWALIGILLTIAAAAWCGMTTYQKINADAHRQAIEQAQRTLPYRLTAQSLTRAQNALDAKLAESQPTDLPAPRLAEWNAGQAAAVNRLTLSVRVLQDRLRDLTPDTHPDPIAIARGVGVEVIKFLGFAAFGLLPIGLPPAPPPVAVVVRQKRVSWWTRLKAAVSLATLATLLSPVAHAEAGAPLSGARETTPATPVAQNVLELDLTWQAKALALRGKMDVPEIAKQVGRDKSTVYRLFRKRDALLKAQKSQAFSDAA